MREQHHTHTRQEGRRSLQPQSLARGHRASSSGWDKCVVCLVHFAWPCLSPPLACLEGRRATALLNSNPDTWLKKKSWRGLSFYIHGLQIQCPKISKCSTVQHWLIDVPLKTQIKYRIVSTWETIIFTGSLVVFVAKLKNISINA